MLASRLQEESVKLLKDDEHVGPVAPSAHHRGKDVARSQPHRDTDWAGSCCHPRNLTELSRAPRMFETKIFRRPPAADKNSVPCCSNRWQNRPLCGSRRDRGRRKPELRRAELRRDREPTVF